MATSERDIPLFFHPYVDQIGELETFVEVAWAGLSYADVAKSIAELRKPRESSEADVATRRTKHYEARLDRAHKLEEFAKSHIKSDFSYLYGLASVRLWTILEAMVGNLVLHILTHCPEVLREDSIAQLKGPLVAFAQAADAERAAYLADLLSQGLGTKLKVGAGRFETILDKVGFGGSIEDSTRRAILELSEIRNVVVHRNFIADKRLAERCAWRNVRVDELISISPIQFENYILASYYYIIQLSQRWESRFPSENSADLSRVQTLDDNLVRHLKSHGF